MKYFFILISLFSFFSCHENTHKDETAFFGIIYASMERDKNQQLFLDNLAEAITSVKSDNNIEIDTEKLKALLDSAKESNIKLRKVLNGLKEVDEEINVKEKGLKYENLLYSAYQNEFKTSIDLLEEKTENKFDSIVQVAKPKLEEVAEAKNNFEDAMNAMMSKYNFTIK